MCVCVCVRGVGAGSAVMRWDGGLTWWARARVFFFYIFLFRSWEFSLGFEYSVYLGQG